MVGGDGGWHAQRTAGLRQTRRFELSSLEIGQYDDSWVGVSMVRRYQLKLANYPNDVLATPLEAEIPRSAIAESIPLLPLSSRW